MDKKIAEMEKEIARITFGPGVSYTTDQFPCYVNRAGKHIAIVDKLFSFAGGFYKIMDCLKDLIDGAGYDMVREVLLRPTSPTTVTIGTGWTEKEVMKFAKGLWRKDENIFTAINRNLMFRYLPVTSSGPVFVVRCHEPKLTQWVMVKEIKTEKPEGWDPTKAQYDDN